MATERLEQTDAYMRAFGAVVQQVDGAAVALDRCAFYPGGGGQPSDTGVLRGDGREWPVERARADGDAVWLDLGGSEVGAPGLGGPGLGGPGLLAGAAVSGEIDWERRHALMRTHTALHVLCGVVWRDWGAKVTGGNMEPLSGRMDFEFESLTGDLVREIEARVNAEIAADRLVGVSFLPREQADLHPDLIRTKINLLPASLTVVRVVEIAGLDTQADGGTHVASTGEVGRVVVTGYKSKGRVNKRIEIAIEE